MGGGANIFVFLSCENVEGDHVDFGVTVLTGLGGGHLHNLARAALKIKIFNLKRSEGGRRPTERSIFVLESNFSDLTNFSKCKQNKNCELSKNSQNCEKSRQICMIIKIIECPR